MVKSGNMMKTAPGEPIVSRLCTVYLCSRGNCLRKIRKARKIWNGILPWLL